jgi:alanine dehydrogenase
MLVDGAAVVVIRFLGDTGMNIGIAKEHPERERRTALAPAGVQLLSESGHTVYVESGAGLQARFSDDNYINVGGRIVYSTDEVYHRSDMILKVTPPSEHDCDLLDQSQILLSFLHMAVARRQVVDKLLQKRVTAIGYELIEDESGSLPILHSMSEIAGQMCAYIAARYLESNNGGRGILLGGIAGIPPAAVVILGAGVVGQAAARAALGVGAQVIILDKDMSRLRNIERLFEKRVTTALSNTYNIAKGVRFADVLIGAVRLKGEKAPHLVTEEMVKTMKPGAVLIDVSIDQGGCVETSRPTTFADPAYVLHGVIHYCVPNIPSSAGRTASYGLTNAILPFLLEIADKGIEYALDSNRGLANGTCVYKGVCTNSSVAKIFDLPYGDVKELVK